VHDLDAGDQDSGAAKGLESEHRPGDAFERISMADPLSAWMLVIAAVGSVAISRRW